MELRKADPHSTLRFESPGHVVYTLRWCTRIRVFSVECSCWGSGVHTPPRFPRETVWCIDSSCGGLREGFNDFLRDASSKSEDVPPKLDELANSGIRLVISDKQDPDGVVFLFVDAHFALAFSPCPRKQQATGEASGSSNGGARSTVPATRAL